ncbi:Exodeoxyribonuclease VII large subunit [Lachnospiraceae bacterium C7]|nr:Exodeoxyribonuclease VII large subunit [Lachnospiraceae bacterium C7]
MNKNVYKVQQINSYIKNMFAQDFMLRNISIKGEISNCKYHYSGHIYFSLKDEKSVMHCVMFKSRRKGLDFEMKDGDSVVVTGSVEVFERDGTYQMYANKIELDGAGDLYQKFDALKKELEEMGMFAEEYKQPIPRYIKTLGVVTASTGAAIRDIQNVATRRNPHIQIILYPAQVQGEGASESIVNGIRALEAYGVDTMIVGRGGGSIEDLWAFNERIVAEAIFNCSVPIISAVGHQTDFTIADFVSDLRAPTPSAAAELAVFDYEEVKAGLENVIIRMNNILNRKLENSKMQLKYIEQKIEYNNPIQKLNEKKTLIVQYEDKLLNLMNQRLKDAKQHLAILTERFEANSPTKKLSKGFVYASKDSKNLVSISQIKKGDNIEIQLIDGSANAKITKVTTKDVI